MVYSMPSAPSGDRALDETLDLILMYQDLLEEKWTRAQWEAVRWRLMLSTYEEIAGKLGVACVFRHKSATHSDPNRPPVPFQIGRAFRRKSATPE